MVTKFLYLPPPFFCYQRGTPSYNFWPYLCVNFICFTLQANFSEMVKMWIEFQVRFPFDVGVCKTSRFLPTVDSCARVTTKGFANLNRKYKNKHEIYFKTWKSYLISFSLAQSDHIKRLLLYFKIKRSASSPFFNVRLVSTPKPTSVNQLNGVDDIANL